MPSLLLGQNVAPRHPRRRRALKLLLAGALPAAALLGSFALGRQFPVRQAPAPWPPPKVHLVPAISEPQTPVTAYVPTDSNWLLRVTFEPVRRPGAFRLLGVEPLRDGACTVHVRAEALSAEQLRAIEAGLWLCFFTKDR